jgi:hypothetical protein
MNVNMWIEIQQMMFVSGEVAEPLSETTGLVEDIVRAQVVEMVKLPPNYTNPRSFKQQLKQPVAPLNPFPSTT